MKDRSVKIKSIHNKIFIYISSKMFKIMNIHFKLNVVVKLMSVRCLAQQLCKCVSLLIRNTKNNHVCFSLNITDNLTL